jgi:hypothetical protein
MRIRMLRLVGVVFAAAILFGLWPAGAAQAQDSRCFPETGQCISGPIRAYWERNGGLPIFGFPIAAQRQETVEGRSLQVQWFERDRIEIQADGSVTTGRLGVDRLAQLGAPWQQGPGLPAGNGCLAFRETGHQVCGAFARFWQQNGGINRLGLPISGEFQTQIEGQTLTVQYFERRRFELHGGNQVLLGLLGREVLNGGGQGGPADPCAGIPAATYAAIEPNCARIGTVFYAAGEGFLAGERVGAYITAPDQSVFGAPFQLEADRDGVTGVVTFNSGVLPNDSRIDGIWAVTFEGVESGRRGVAYFRILR